MEDQSIFMMRESIPGDKELEAKLGNLYSIWNEIRKVVIAKYPEAIEEWNYPGKKYGWSFRLKDKKRAIIYLLPRDQYFKVAFVFGQKATDKIMESDLPSEIKTDLANTRKYAEGRGIKIDIKDAEIIPDIAKLIEIKLMY